MTTILAHRQTLYADSRCTQDNAAFRMRKVMLVERGDEKLIVACAGETFAREEFLRQLRLHGATKLLYVPEGMKIKDTDFSALLIDQQGIWHFDHKFSADWIDGTYFAIGAGQEAVLGAIECQKLTPACPVDPLRAMMAACKVNVANSGGPIQHMTYGEFVLHKESV